MGEWKYSSTILDLGTTCELSEWRPGAMWAPEPIWMLCSREESLTPTGNRNPAVQSVAIPTEVSRLFPSLRVH
jgi:hypothetical protein